MFTKKPFLLFVLFILGTLLLLNCSKSKTTDTELDGELVDNGTAQTAPAKTNSSNVLSSIKKDNDGNITIEINKNLQISNIKVDNDQVDFPFRKSGSGRKYPFVKPSGDEGNALLTSIESNILSFNSGNKIGGDAEYKPLEVAGVEVRLNKSGKGSVKGYPEVSLVNGLVLSSFAVTYSRGELMVRWPAIRGEGRQHIQSIDVVNKEDKEKLEKSILDEFKLVAEAEKFDYTGGGPASSSRYSGNSKPTGEVAITEIGNDGNDKYIIINGKLKISGIKIDGDEIIMPYSVSNSGRKHPFIEKPNRGSDEAIEQLKTDLSENNISNKNVLNLDITDVYFRRNFGKVTFNNAFAIDSFYLSRNRVSWPSDKVDGKFVEKITAVDNSFKKEVEDALVKKYSGSNSSRKNSNRSYRNNRSRSSNRRSGRSSSRKKGKYSKGDIVNNVKILGVGTKGDGRGKLDDGKVIFVKGAQEGDVVDVEITGQSSSVYFGKIAE